MKLSLFLRRSAYALTAMCGLSSCADYTNQANVSRLEQQPDSLEGFNRAMGAVNTGLDKAVIRPVTVGYRFVVPETGRTMVSNFVKNIYSPVVFANSVMQGDQENSFGTFWRFVLNTTVGIGGLFDVAGSAGLKTRDADFGQTLAVWGVPSGPYLVLPIFGPGTLRDSFGRGVDIALNPVTWANEDWYGYTLAGMTIVDRRNANFKAIDDIYRTSLDPYVTFRSAYLQRRTYEINQARQAVGLKPMAPVAPAQ